MYSFQSSGKSTYTSKTSYKLKFVSHMYYIPLLTITPNRSDFKEFRLRVQHLYLRFSTVTQAFRHSSVKYSAKSSKNVHFEIWNSIILILNSLGYRIYILVNCWITLYGAYSTNVYHSYIISFYIRYHFIMDITTTYYYIL